MNEFSHPEFDYLMKKEGNDSCFDCGKGPATWASVNNSIYLCLDCAGLHRGFGVETSFIRSVTMDKWKARHVELMKNGGNNRLKRLLIEYGVDLTFPREDLYYTKLLDYYRLCLKNEVTGETQPTKIELSEALQSLKKINTKNTENKFGSISSNSETTTNNLKIEKNDYSFKFLLMSIILVGAIIIFSWLKK